MSEYIIECDYNVDNGLIPGEVREEIVRCQDCNCSSFDEFGGGWCNENCREIKQWNFCTWGERKDGGE